MCMNSVLKSLHIKVKSKHQLTSTAYSVLFGLEMKEPRRSVGSASVQLSE